jgi:PhnB protein
MQISPYLIFDGQCEAAFQFYADMLGADITIMQTYGESPAATQVPAEAHARVIHTELRHASLRLMGSDAPPGRGETTGNVHVSLDVDEPAEAERVFAALADGGKVRMPMGETFWARRFGMAVDRFGIPWMVNCSLPQEQPGPPKI